MEGIKYSKDQFEGYTHRFMVQFTTTDPDPVTITFYSNSGSRENLNEFIEKKKKEKVLSFKVVHSATKEQDEHQAKFFEEWLNS